MRSNSNMTKYLQFGEFLRLELENCMSIWQSCCCDRVLFHHRFCYILLQGFVDLEEPSCLWGKNAVIHRLMLSKALFILYNYLSALRTCVAWKSRGRDFRWCEVRICRLQVGTKREARERAKWNERSPL